MTEKKLAYTSGGRGYIGLALCAGERRPKAVVVLLPDWRGQSGLARAHAKFLITLGYDVVIADLYGDGFTPKDPSEVGVMVKRLIESRPQGAATVANCIEAATKELQFSGPIFVLGYSAGGMMALDFGRSGATVAGIIVCSGLLKTAASGMSSKIKTPVLLLQGTQDVVSPMEVISTLVKEMDEAGNDFRIELLGQTHHAFDNPEAGTDPTARLVYSPRSAERARQATAEFIAANIR